MDEHIGAAEQEDCMPEVLRDHHYDGIVILPYSQNVALDKRGIA